MKRWQRKALESGWVKFPDDQYKPVYKHGYVCHIFSKATDNQNLYPIGRTPRGYWIVSTLEEWHLIYGKDKWSPVSIHSIDPDLPLTSFLIWNTLDKNGELE